MQTLSNAIQINHCLLKQAVKKGKFFVDATCGNGFDTLFLAENTNDNAHIYAFDIQKEALENTRRKTAQYQDKISYICDSHLKIREYVKEKIDAAVFNLGYLPQGTHSITTCAPVVLQTLDELKNLLKRNGIISILAYPGHAEGRREYQQLLKYTRRMDKHVFTACWYRLHNHDNAPALCWIEKQG